TQVQEVGHHIGGSCRSWGGTDHRRQCSRLCSSHPADHQWNRLKLCCRSRGRSGGRYK
ncbi:hypothetical protein NDU88_006171, partial [Pleurodeles waltl]